MRQPIISCLRLERGLGGLLNAHELPPDVKAEFVGSWASSFCGNESFSKTPQTRPGGSGTRWRRKTFIIRDLNTHMTVYEEPYDRLHKLDFTQARPHLSLPQTGAQAWLVV